MERFPYSWGSLDVSRYPNAQYLNVRIMKTDADGNIIKDSAGNPVFEDAPVPCMVMPVNEHWMRVYADSKGNVHGTISVNIDDATALNSYLSEQAKKDNKSHTDFVAQIHVAPDSNERAAWSKRLAEKYGAMPYADFESEAKKMKLDEYSINTSDYYAKHPDKKPTREQIIQRMVSNEIQRQTSAGRIYSNELSSSSAPAAPSAPAASVAVPPVPAQPVRQEAVQDDLPF